MSRFVFKRYRWIWWTSFGTKDVSLGIHLCWAGRIDIHIGTGMLSLGVIPMYHNVGREQQCIREVAVSNSYHQSVQDMRAKMAERREGDAAERMVRKASRAGVPYHG